MSSENDARLTGTSYAVLGLIGYLQPCTPYDLKRFIEQSVENFWPVPHTTFYAEPARLAQAGYLTETQETSGRRRKQYGLTEAGRQALDAWVHVPAAPPPQLRDELMLKVFLGADPGPLLRERLQWHERKLAELQGYLDDVRNSHGPEGIERSLIGGTAYHDSFIALTRAWLGGAAAPAETSPSDGS
jgi:DNA-binding PadR family transcriptional regulator